MSDALPTDHSQMIDAPSATASVSANVNRDLSQTNHQLADSYTRDANVAGRGLLNSHTNFNNSMSYGDQATSAAIKSRYDQQYNRSEKEIGLQALRGAQEDHVRNLQVASQAAGQEVELNKQKAILKWKKEQADKVARGQILGTTLGIVGGVVGAIYGGPGGAAAGYGLGSGVGNAVGSS